MTNRPIILITHLTCSTCSAPCSARHLDDADGFLCDDCADLS